MGQFKSALKTALRLTDYELDMDVKKIYTLVALAAYYNKVTHLGCRVIRNVREPSSNLKEWALQRREKGTLTSL